MLATLILLVAILLVNTLRFTSRQVTPSPIDRIELDEAQLAQRLAGAIRIPTISQADGTVDGAALLALHDYLAQSFPLVHARLGKETISDYSLLYTWPGRDPTAKPILLLAHLDVVPVEDEAAWTHPPFAGTIADGFIWGRGAMDDKASVLGILEAVERLLAEGFQPERTLYLAFGHDEEIGGKNGATKIAARLQERQVALETILDEGFFITEGILPGVTQPVALIGIAEKGILNLALTVAGTGGHAATPPPQTTIGVLSAAIRQLETHPLPGGLHGAVAQMFDAIGPELPFGQRLIFANLWLFRPLVERRLAAAPSTNALLRTTTAVTRIDGGVKENVLPSQANALVNLRLLPGDSIEEVTAHVQQTIADPRVQIGPHGNSNSEPSAISPTDGVGFQTLQRTIRQVFPDVLVAPGQVLGGTDARHYAALSPNIYRFLPQRLGAADVARLHGTNERLAVADYADGVRFYVQLIKNSSQ